MAVAIIADPATRRNRDRWSFTGMSGLAPDLLQVAIGLVEDILGPQPARGPLRQALHGALRLILCLQSSAPAAAARSLFSQCQSRHRQLAVFTIRDAQLVPCRRVSRLEADHLFERGDRPL